MRQWIYKYTLGQELWSKLMQIIFMYTVYRSEGTDNLYIITKKMIKALLVGAVCNWPNSQSQAQGCGIGPLGYIGWRAGTTTLCQSGTKNWASGQDSSALTETDSPPIHRNWNPWFRTGFVAFQDPPSSNQNAAICPSPEARASMTI